MGEVRRRRRQAARSASRRPCAPTPRRSRPSGPTRRPIAPPEVSGPSAITPSQPRGTCAAAAAVAGSAARARAISAVRAAGAWNESFNRPDASGLRRRTLDSRRRWPPASLSSTTSCSTSAGRSASSPRSATRGRRPTSSPPSTTRRGTEGRFADRRAAHVVPAARAARPRARSAPLLPLYPHAIESLDLRGYDIVISSSSAWAHGVLVDPGAVHVCYCHNPFRYAWTEREATLRARGPLAAPAAAPAAQPLAPVGLDRRPARRPLRRQLAPDRRARAPLPRPRGDRPAPAGRDSSASRPAATRVGDALRRAGRADGAQAHRRRRRAPSTRSGRPLVVVGDGPEVRRLRRLAGPNVTLHRPRQRRARRRAARAARGRWSSPRPRSSASRRSRRSPPGGR